MATLTEHTMLNGLEENLKSAIEYAGGNIPDNTCVWMYPDIIRNQLSGGSNSLNLIAGDGIEIVKNDDGIMISTKLPNTEQITIDAIDAPEFSGISTWPEGTILQNLLEDLFYKVLPKLPSITKGDVIITDSNGGDQYAPELESYIDSLRPNTPYLRLFLVSQKDPIYISMEKIIGIGGNGGSVDLSNYYTINQIDNKFGELRQEIDNLEFDVDLTDYYTKDDVDNKLLNYYNITETLRLVDSRIKEAIDNLKIPSVDLSDYYTKKEIDTKIDSIEIPEIDLSDYYTKEEIHDVIKDIEIITSLDSKPITVKEVTEKVINQENQLSEITNELSNIDNTIIHTVRNETASIEDAYVAFDNIFKYN